MATSVRRVTTTGEEVINLNPSLSGVGRIVAFETTANLAGVSSGHGFRAISADLSANTAAFTQLGMSRAVAPAEDLVGSNPDRNSEIFLFDGAAVSQITNTTPGGISTRVRDGNFQPSIADDGNIIAFSSSLSMYNGCTETSNNAGDFAAGPPNPRNRERGDQSPRRRYDFADYLR